MGSDVRAHRRSFTFLFLRSARPCGLGLFVALALGLGARANATSLLHEWTFNNTTADLVGGADATLFNGASVQNGELVLDGDNDYASLPIATTLANLNSFSIEAWVTWTDMSQRAWARVFDFGNDTKTNMFFTPRNNRADSGLINRPRYAITVDHAWNEEQLNPPESFQRFPLDTQVYIAVTYDSTANTGKLYLDGVLVATNTNMTLAPSAIKPTNNWLGRSQYAADPYFRGTIDEFRIYDGVLTQNDIANSGPTPDVPEPLGTSLLALAAAGALLLRRRGR